MVSLMDHPESADSDVARLEPVVSPSPSPKLAPVTSRQAFDAIAGALGLTRRELRADFAEQLKAVRADHAAECAALRAEFENSAKAQIARLLAAKENREAEQRVLERDLLDCKRELAELRDEVRGLKDAAPGRTWNGSGAAHGH